MVLHINGDHWVCATTVGTKKQVLVYDSWYTKWDEHTSNVAPAMFIWFKNVQKQQGATECGLQMLQALH